MIVNEIKYPWLVAAAISGNLSTGGYHQNNATIPTTDREFDAPWWQEGWSPEGRECISAARIELEQHGAVAFPEFLTQDAVARAVEEMRTREDNAFTTNTEHTAYLKHLDTENYPDNSIYNHPTKTIVASTAYDELPEDSVLKELYTDPRLLKMVSSIVLPDNNKAESKLYLSEDPLGCCSVNVFRPGYFHGFHYDESEFSVTLMLQDAEDPQSGLFQYTDPIRSKKAQNIATGGKDDDDNELTLELKTTADIFRDHEHDPGASDPNSTAVPKIFAEHEASPSSAVDEKEQDGYYYYDSLSPPAAPTLHTLEFRPGTLLVLAGSRSLHRVTAVKGNRSRFVAVLTFARKPGFCNTPEVQEMFWGRTGAPTINSNSNSCSNSDLQEHACEVR